MRSTFSWTFLKKHDLIFDEEMLENLTNFQLNKYSSKIDEFFEKGGDKPKRKSKNRC